METALNLCFDVWSTTASTAVSDETIPPHAFVMGWQLTTHVNKHGSQYTGQLDTHLVLTHVAHCSFCVVYIWFYCHAFEFSMETVLTV